MGSFGKDSRPGIDYESLMSLSNGSGLEAIRTMTDLSDRVSVRSTSSRGSNRGQKRRTTAAGAGRSLSSSKRKSSASSTGSQASKHKSKLRKSPVGTDESRPRPSLGYKKDSHDADRPSNRRKVSRSTDSLGRRQSTLTTSSDSTKLGEIKHGKHAQPVQANYPLRGYRREPVAPPKKGKWFGLFSR